MSVESQSYSRETLDANILSNTSKELFGLKKEIVDNDLEKKVDLKKKPITLGYKEIYKEQKIAINLPDEYSAQGRILRCMRWKSITDVVEDKYDIPRGLLLAMMAQEGMGDPTMPNLGGDGGLGLIHIQAKNAADYGLKTLPRYNEGMKDLQHGKEITKAKKNYNNELKKLIKVDDRFHPIMGLDCSARFLKDVYNRTEPGKDRRINALRKYSGRALNDYLRPVVKYWILINEYTGDKLPDFTKSTNSEIQKMKNAKTLIINDVDVPINIVKTSVESRIITIDGKTVSYEVYLEYFNKQAINYGLNDYKKSFVTPQETTQPEKLLKKNPVDRNTKDLKYLKESKDKQWYVYKYTIPSDITIFDLTNIYHEFIGTTFQITDANGNEIKRPNIPSKKGDVFYIKEKKN